MPSAVELYKHRVMEAMKAGDLNALKGILVEIAEDRKNLDEVEDNVKGLMVQLRYFAVSGGEPARAAAPAPVAAVPTAPVPAPEPVVEPVIEPVIVPEPVAVPLPEPVVAPMPDLVFDEPVVAPVPMPGPAPAPMLDIDEVLGVLEVSPQPEPAADEFDVSFLDEPSTPESPAAKDDFDFDFELP